MSLTLSQRRAFNRNGDREIQRCIDQAKREMAADAAVEDAEKAARYEAHKARTAPVEFTTEQLKAATHVRTELGWHKVAKINAKTVSVETGYSWTDRYVIAKILEVRTIN
jgi:hypothetical protein